jgi:small conductance mechanosensitive channel
MTISLFALDTLWEGFLDFLPRLGAGALVLVVAWMLSRWLAHLIARGMRRRDADTELIVLLEMLTRWGILVLGIVLALEQVAPGRFGSLIAGLGVAGLTLGFALQDAAKNFISGILLLLDQPMEIGDSVEVAGFEGTVLEIKLRTTELRTWDGRHVLLANSQVFTSPIVNLSRARRRRIELSAGVAYDSDLDQVTRSALAAIRGVVGLLDDPAPEVVFQEFRDSAISFRLYYWVDTQATTPALAQDAGLKAVKRAFEVEGIDMPYPTMQVLTASPGEASPS